MALYILRRVVWTLFILLAISFITFVIFTELPAADPVALRAGRGASPEVQAAVRHSLGLDKSWLTQYWIQLKQLVLHFNFGQDYFNGTSVRSELFDRLPATVGLALGGMVVWLTLGIAGGILSALRRGRAADHLSMGAALLSLSAPSYWLGLVMLYVFSKGIGLVPIFDGQGSYPTSGNLFTRPGATFGPLVLPWIVLGLSLAGIYARFMRGSLLDALSQDYVRTARAKGLPERKVVVGHAVRTAITPIITILGLDLGGVLGGSILVEAVFNIPGLGPFSIQAIGSENIPAIQGTVLIAALFVVVANLVVDVAYAFLDPRVRFE